MTHLVILADDLTGAADSAAALARAGSTSVVLDHDGDWPDADVVAVDTDSRHRESREAAARVAAVTARAQELGARVAKKIDSTLRGHIAAEIRAITDVLGPVLVVVAPAFPATGRTTVGGVVHVDGSPLRAHGSDGDVVGLLERGGLRSVLVPATALAEARAAGHHAVVVDARSEADLAAVVDAAELATFPVLLVGSGGLTRLLAAPTRASYEHRPAPGPTLVVVGSYAEASRAQRARLVESGLAAVTLDDVSGLRSALAAGPVVLSPDPDAPVLRAEAPAVARALADAAGDVLDEVGTLVATGGETARSLLTAAGVTRLVVIGEIEPGVVCGRVPELELDVITKAGGFGDADTLLRCLPTTVHPGGAP